MRYTFEVVDVVLRTDEDEYLYDGHKVLCRDNNLRTAYVFKKEQFNTRKDAQKCIDYYTRNGLENRLDLDWIEVFTLNQE